MLESFELSPITLGLIGLALPIVQGVFVQYGAGPYFKRVTSLAFAAVMAGLLLVGLDWSVLTAEVAFAHFASAWTAGQLAYHYFYGTLLPRLGYGDGLNSALLPKRGLAGLPERSEF